MAAHTAERRCCYAGRRVAQPTRDFPLRDSNGNRVPCERRSGRDRRCARFVVPWEM